MRPAKEVVTPPAISTLIEGDPIFARMDEVHQSIVNRAYELFKRVVSAAASTSKTGNGLDRAVAAGFAEG